VHLIDDRFGRPEIQQLMPAWWRVEDIDSKQPIAICNG
jgi:hypothetical protein